MFVCKPCKEDLNLTEAGQNWPWGKSFGECESCEDTADCGIFHASLIGHGMIMLASKSKN